MSFKPQQMRAGFVIATACVSLASLLFLLMMGTPAYAQLGVIQSVSRYKSCIASPLYQPNSNTCQNFTDNEEVIVIRAQVHPSSRANVQNLVFTLRDIPNADQTHIFQDGSEQSFACRGVPVGAECNVTQNILVISFDASRMFAGYTLQERAQYIPACYSIQAVTNLKQTCDKKENNCTSQSTFVSNYGNKIGTFATQTCATIGGITNVASLNAAFPLSSGGEQSACATTLGNPKAQEFYTAPQTNSIYSSTGDCPLIYCRTKVDTNGKNPEWTLSSPLPVPYLCSVNDIEPTARAIMGADIVLQTKAYADSGADVISTERLQVSTIKGGMPVRSNSTPVAAQLLRINKGLGVAGPIVLGAVITCNAGGVGNNAPGMMNDAPGRLSPEDRATGKGTVLDDFYNPYTETHPIEGVGQSRNMLQRCVLPTEACRKMMLPKWYRERLNQSLPVGHYYYATFGRLNEYGEQCNQNGMDPQLIFQSLPILFRYCEAQAKKRNDNGGVAGECVPGYQQDPVASAGSVTYTSTPVVANINHANYLASIEALADSGDENSGVPTMKPFPKPADVPSVDYMPLDYLPNNPNYWLAHGMLVREGLFGSSSAVSLDVQIMVQAKEFLGQVTARSSGKFLDTGMSCDATTSGQGRVAYTTQSLGNIGGPYYIVPTPIIPPGGNPNTDITPELQSILLNTGNFKAPEVHYQERQWGRRDSATGGRDQWSFPYTYGGPLENMLQFRLDLYIPAGGATGSAGFALVDSVTVGCTITRGVVQDLAGKTAAGKVSKGEDLSNVYQCIYWYNNIFRCWGHYDRTWKLLVNLMVTVVVLLSALCATVTGVLAVCLAYLRGRKVIEVSRSELNQLNESGQ